MLKVTGLKKIFDTGAVLNELDLSIEKGCIFGLVGVNGAGKSTLLRTIAGIYRPDEGTVEFEGENTYCNEKIRKDLFLVSDDVYFPFAANIATLKQFYGSFYSFDDETFRKCVELFRLPVNKSINTFSKGMKRQTLLSCALAIAPKLLMLDEAFDGLDPIVRHNLKKMLDEFVKKNKTIVIISSHNLKELEDICDSFGLLEEGKIKTYGDLLKSKANINKYQLVFNEMPDENAFDEFDIMQKSKEGSVCSLVIRGDREEVTEKLKKYEPLVCDVLPVNFEELFIYETEGGKENVL